MLIKFFDELEQKELTAVVEDDGPSPELDVGFDLGAFFEEFLGMPYFELEVMFVGIGPEAYFLDDGLERLGLDLLVFFLLVVQELVEVDNTTYRRYGVGGDLDQVHPEVGSPLLRYPGRIYSTLDGLACDGAYFFQIIAHQSYLWYSDLVIDPESIFFLVFSADTALFTQRRIF